MSTFSYVAFDAHGQQITGLINVSNQSEALLRLKEMGYFPTKVVQKSDANRGATVRSKGRRRSVLHADIPGFGNRVPPKVLCVFTRQMATLIEAGMPLLRGLRLIEEQEPNANLKRIIGEISASIEGGSSLSEALAQHPKVFNRLYINMVKAGELGGVLDVVLKRLADFMEKAQKIKGKVIAGLFYPAAVIMVAIAVLAILLICVVPKFKAVFVDLLGGKPLPAFTVFVLNISEAAKNHFVLFAASLATAAILLKVFISTKPGRRIFDHLKLRMPIIGPVIRKAAISRFARTFGTLVSSGVPMLQSLVILRETSGNQAVGDAVLSVHESVKQGETITLPLKASKVFPSIVVGMIDVGEQTGALPEMLMKIADTYDNEVDDAITAMTSLLEPIMIVFLAIVVGSIVVAMFWPMVILIEGMPTAGDDASI